MALDAAQQQQLATWLARKQLRPTCPACGALNRWTPGPLVAALRVRDGNLHIGEPVEPLLPLTCDNCAHVLFFAAIPLGLYTPSSNECRQATDDATQ